MYKKILLRILMLASVLVILNYIYTKWLYEIDLQKYSEIINLVRNVPNDAEIIYLGESSNTTFLESDIDKRPISDFIGDYFPELKTCDITKPASHAGIYKELLKIIPSSNEAKTIIITLNLRSFNAQWIYSDLETSLQKSLVLIKPYPPLFNRFLLSFKAYDIKTKSERKEEFITKWKKDKFHFPYDFQFNNVIEWDNWMAYNGIKDINGNFDKAQTELACHYIKTYGFHLDTLTNPRIKDFNEIIELAQKRNWNLIFNLLAENTEKAEKLVGKDLIYLINNNAEILKNYYEERGVVVVNNLNKVADDQYIDQHWTTEHYAEKGRKIIAANVAETLKIWYNDYYEAVKYKNDFQTSFVNNCDEGIIWGQMQTITSNIAYSGDYSSMTGDGSDFSITLEYPLKQIPDSLKNYINIEFWIFQESLDHDAKVVIQANGQDFSSYWNGFDIKPDITETNKWVKYNKHFLIPDSIKQADLIKIYVYNPSKEKVYVDDFKINIMK